MIKNLPASGGDCLQNSMDRETWQATIHGVTKSQTRLSSHIRVYGKCREDLCFLGQVTDMTSYYLFLGDWVHICVIICVKCFLSISLSLSHTHAFPPLILSLLSCMFLPFHFVFCFLFVIAD